MRVVDEKELHRIWWESPERAFEVLEQVDYVMTRGAWFDPPEYFKKKIERWRTLWEGGTR